MAQGGIKKGFFFYFGLFVLLLITIFCICLVIMIFNPGRTVLWMKYFSGNDYIKITQTTDDNKLNLKWDGSQFSDVVINCSYGNVVVDYSENAEMTETGLYIRNGAKGFSVASKDDAFRYSAVIEGSRLKIDVTEPNGFLYFSKDFEIVLHADVSKNSEENFENLSLFITTTSGNVTLGSENFASSKELDLAGATVKTTSGNIFVTEKLNTNNLNTIDFETVSGKLSSLKDVIVDEKNYGKGLSFNCDASFSVTGTGLISYNALHCPEKIVNLTCRSGNIDMDYVKALDVVFSDCVQGNYVFGNVYSNLSFRSEDTLLSPNITAKFVSGNFSLVVDPSLGGEPVVRIDEVGGNVSMIADKGSLKIKKANKSLMVESNGPLNIDVVMAEKIDGTISVSNKSGNIHLGFMGEIPLEFLNDEQSKVPGVRIIADTGKISIDVTTDASFVATCYVNDGTGTLLDENKIERSLGNEVAEGKKNPLTVNPTGSDYQNRKMEVTTNNKVSFSLVSKDSLTA